MQILRVFNNNVVLARRGDGTEVVLTGRGLGFQRRAGEEVDPLKVVRVFEPTDGRDPDTLGGLVAAIPPEHIALAEEALDLVGVPVTATTLVAVADHLSFAIKRVHQGIELEMPLRAEVEHLYPRELDRARRVLEHVNGRLPEPLPQDEAVAIAMHLVNAAMMGGDLSETYAMTGIIKQLFEVIESALHHAPALLPRAGQGRPAADRRGRPAARGHPVVLPRGLRVRAAVPDRPGAAPRPVRHAGRGRLPHPPRRTTDHRGC